MREEDDDRREEEGMSGERAPTAARGDEQNEKEGRRGSILIIFEK